MTLSDLKIGQTACIEAISGERSFRRRLLELGLVPGTPVRFLRQAPLGDPMEFEVRGCRLSIRQREAAEVRVTPLATQP